MTRQNGTAAESFWKLFAFIKPYKFSLLLSITSAFLSVVFSLFLPILLGKAIDKITGKSTVDFAGLGQILKLMFIVLILAVVFQWVMNQVNTYLSFHVIEDLRKKAFSHIQAVPLSRRDFKSFNYRHRTDFTGIICSTESVFAGGVQYFGNCIFSLSSGMENCSDPFDADASFLFYRKVYIQARLPVFSESV